MADWEGGRGKEGTWIRKALCWRVVETGAATVRWMSFEGMLEVCKAVGLVGAGRYLGPGLY